MAAERNAFKLGLTLIVFAGLLVAVLVYLAPTGGGDVLFRVRYPHGKIGTPLKPGGEVSCGGQAVGAIRRIELAELEIEEEKDAEEGEGKGKDVYVVVTISVDSRRVTLRERCKITPEAPILGAGGKLTILHVGDGDPLEDGAMIDGDLEANIANLTRALQGQLDPEDPGSLISRVKAMLDPANEDSLLGKILASLDDVNAVTRQLEREFDPAQKRALLAKLHGIMDSLNQATGLLRDEIDRDVDAAMAAKLHEMLDTLNDGLATAAGLLEENRAPITETVQSIRDTSKILEEQIAARIARQLDPKDGAALMAKVHVAIDRLGRSLSDINTITDAGRETMLLNKELINRMVGNFKETSDHLKGASKDIRRSPWRLFYQPTIEESAEANVFDAARAFAEAATRLDDAMARVQAVSEIRPDAIAEDEQLREIRDQLKRTFEQFTQAETALWEQLDIR